MTKERRLGRGLEALLGQLPVRNEPALPAQQRRPPAALAARPTPRPSPAADQPPAAAAAPSAEALFRLDVPHAAPGQFCRPAAPSAGRRRRPTQPPPAATCRRQDGRLDRRPTSHVRRGSTSARSTATRPSRARTSTPTKCSRWPRAFRPTGCCSRWSCGGSHDRYQLVAGERRLRAAIQAGWVDVPVNVVEADDRQMAELAIVENLQRKDLNPLEKAASFQKYLDQYGCTQEELAGRLKLDRSTIANLIRLLELPEPVQEAIRRGKITQGHARALLPLGDEREQIEFCRRIQREGLNVRQTEALVQETIDAADREPLAAVETPAKPTPPVAGEERAHRRLGAGIPHGVGHEGEDHPQRPRPRQAGGPVPQSRGVRAAEEARLRRIGAWVFGSKAWANDPRPKREDQGSPLHPLESRLET